MKIAQSVDKQDLQMKGESSLYITKAPLTLQNSEQAWPSKWSQSHYNLLCKRLQSGPGQLLCATSMGETRHRTVPC